MNSIISLLGAIAFFNQALSAPAPQKFPGDVSLQDPRFTYYPFNTPWAGPCDLTTGPDGAIWSSNFITNTIGRVDPITGDISEYQVPSVNLTKLRLGDILGKVGLSCVIQPGSDGFLSTRRQKRSKSLQPPSTGEFPSELGNLEPFNDMWRGPKGIIEYPIPIPFSSPAVIRAETSDADGTYIWFTAFTGNYNGRVNIKTGEIKAFPSTSLLSFPTENTVDGEGIVWFSTATRNSVNKLNQNTGEVTSMKQPGTLIEAPISVDPRVNIAVHYGPGNAIWFTKLARNRIGRFQL
ncbi:hypothetical protein BKA61DRAFT_577710 [Leptodontidium sp. MPI-SDFR-AT-0119]|nr:hypothetical protein BKA61DRAFT_577710 [Leptodontidium sp. MPI-SDFR-AT-0119]